jgi:hypothetical protein
VVLAGILPVALFIAWEGHRATPVEFLALFTELRAEEADAVRGVLRSLGVPYELRDGGQTILVPAARRAELTVECTRILRLGLRSPSRLEDPVKGREPALRGAGLRAGHDTGQRHQL